MGPKEYSVTVLFFAWVQSGSNLGPRFEIGPKLHFLLFSGSNLGPINFVILSVPRLDFLLLGPIYCIGPNIQKTRFSVIMIFIEGTIIIISRILYRHFLDGDKMEWLQEGLSNLSGFEQRDVAEILIPFFRENPETWKTVRDALPAKDSIRATSSNWTEEAATFASTQLVNHGYMTYRLAKQLSIFPAGKKADSKTFNRIMAHVSSAIKHNKKHKDGSRVFYYHEDRNPVEWESIELSGPINIQEEPMKAVEVFIERFATGTSFNWRNIMENEKKIFNIGRGPDAMIFLDNWYKNTLHPLLRDDWTNARGYIYEKKKFEEE